MTDPFDPRSTLADRHPAEVPLAEQVEELEQSVRERADWFARDLRAHKTTADKIARHEALWAAILADHAGLRGVGQVAGALTPGIAHADKIAELRREIAIRRNAWPKRIGKSGGLTATEAARRFAALDAVHWRYDRRLFAFSPPGTAPHDHPARIVLIAQRERKQARIRAERIERNHRPAAAPSASLLAEPTFHDHAAPPRDAGAAAEATRLRDAAAGWELVAALAQAREDLQPIDQAAAARAAEFTHKMLCRALLPRAPGEPVDEARVALRGDADRFLARWCLPERAAAIEDECTRESWRRHRDANGQTCAEEAQWTAHQVEKAA